jgi:hypothetical protein
VISVLAIAGYLSGLIVNFTRFGLLLAKPSLGVRH